jgi:chromosome segregation ATPase
MANIWKWLAIMALVLMVAIGAGLGASLAHTSGQLSATSSNLTTTNANLTSTELDLTSTQNELKDAQNTLASTQSQLKIATDNLTATKRTLDSTQQELTSTNSQLTDTQNELIKVQDELNSTSKQLTDIQKVYPPKYFDTYGELRSWVDQALPKLDKSLSNWNQAKQLQNLALSDGYILSLAIQQSGTFILFAIAGPDTYWVYLDGTVEDTGHMN